MSHVTWRSFRRCSSSRRAKRGDVRQEYMALRVPLAAVAVGPQVRPAGMRYCCSVWQSDAVRCCRAWQYVAMFCCGLVQCVAVGPLVCTAGMRCCCRLLQGVAGCCRVLQGVVGCCRVSLGVAGCCRVSYSVAVCCWSVAVCSVLQCVCFT